MGGEPPSLLASGYPCPFPHGGAGHSPLHWPSAASPSPVSLYLFHSLCQPLFAPERSPCAPPSSIVYPHGNRLLYMRLTSPDSAKGAGSFPLARKQLGSAVQFGKGLCQFRARGSVARPLPKGTRYLGLLARCKVAWPSVSALSLPQPECPLHTLFPPALLGPQDVQKECLEELATYSISKGERQTEAGEGARMTLTRSGLPRARPGRLEKPRAALCGKWLFGSSIELLNVLDRLASALSLSNITRQLFRAGRDIRGKRGATIRRPAHRTNTPETGEPGDPWRGGRGSPDVHISFGDALALVLTFPPTLKPHLHLTHPGPGAAALLFSFSLVFFSFPLFLLSWFSPLRNPLSKGGPYSTPQQAH